MGSFSRPRVAIAAGLGMGVAQVIISNGQIIWEARGPGTWYPDDCGIMPGFVSVAVQSSFLILLHVLWTLLLFDGCNQTNKIQTIGVVAGHCFLAALKMVIAGADLPFGCVLSILASLVAVGFYLFWSKQVFVVAGQLRRSPLLHVGATPLRRRP